MSVDELFDLKRGLSKYTKKYCLDNRGSYPVYSANNTSPLGYIDAFDYDGRYATISVNGIAGKITLLDEKFSLNADRVILLPKTDGIDIGYLSFVLEPLLREQTKGRKGENGKNEYTKIDRETILSTKVPIPFNYYGGIDLTTQRQLKNRYHRIREIKEMIQVEFNRLISMEVN